MNVDQTPGGTRTRSFRVEGPASSPFRPRGQEGSGGRARTCALAINSRASYRLDHAGTMRRRQQDSNLRTARSRLRGSNALPCQLGHASTRRKERESNPQGPRAHPFSRRDTAPVAVLPKSGPGRRRTCNPPLKRRQLCQLSYGAVSVTGRDRTCDAPRFRRALYRAELRSREDGRSRSRTGGLLRIREALYHLSYPPTSGRGWARTSSLLFVRQALSLLSYSPSSGPGGSRTLEPPFYSPHLPLRRGCFAELSAIRPVNPGQGVEPRSPRSERGVLPVRRSRNVRAPAAEGARRSIEERDVPHRTRALLGVHHDPVPAVQQDRRVVGMTNRTLREQLGVADEPCPAAATPLLVRQAEVARIADPAPVITVDPDDWPPRR